MRPAGFGRAAAQNGGMTETGIDALGALAEPLRRSLYRYVVRSGGEVSRAEAAEAVGARRTLVAFHLDKLVEAGLLEVTRRKVSGRDGPGSGRPAKLYRRARREHSVQLPPRDYATAAAVLAEAVQRAGAEEAVHAAAREEGERRGAELAAEGPATPAALTAWLERRGYEPVEAPDGAEVRLRNCPFHATAARFPPLACGMNLEMLRGVLAGAGVEGVAARMAPGPEGCCVAITRTDSKTNEC